MSDFIHLGGELNNRLDQRTQKPPPPPTHPPTHIFMALSSSRGRRSHCSYDASHPNRRVAFNTQEMFASGIPGTQL
jgi:hypothetical protein